MKRGILLLLTLSIPLLSQDRLELFGYFESQITTARIQSEWVVLASNKLRLDMAAEVSDRITFSANLNAVTYHGKTRWMIFDLLPEPVLGAIPVAMRPYYFIDFEDRHMLDNVFIEAHLGDMDVTLGKQPLTFGSGYAWNPTDLFNIKDLFDPAYEQPGHHAVRWDWQVGSRTGVTGLITVGETWQRSTGLLQFKVGLSRFDLSLLGARMTQTLSDYTRFDPLTFAVLDHSETRHVLGADVNGEIFGLGVWTEWAFSLMARSDGYYECLFGADYTFGSGTYWMAEWYRNTRGKGDPADHTFNDWLRYLNAETKALSRDQIYALIRHPVTDLMDLGLSGILSLSDQSAAVLPTVRWIPDPNLEITAYANWLTGGDNDVFNPRLGNGGLIRARVYF